MVKGLNLIQQWTDQLQGSFNTYTKNIMSFIALTATFTEIDGERPMTKNRDLRVYRGLTFKLQQNFYLRERKDEVLF